MFTSKSDKTLRKAAAAILGLPEDSSVGYILWDLAHRIKEIERKDDLLARIFPSSCLWCKTPLTEKERAGANICTKCAQACGPKGGWSGLGLKKSK